MKLAPHEIVELGLIQVPEGRELFPFMTVEAYSARARAQVVKSKEKAFELLPRLKERRNQLANIMIRRRAEDACDRARDNGLPRNAPSW